MVTLNFRNKVFGLGVFGRTINTTNYGCSIGKIFTCGGYRPHTESKPVLAKRKQETPVQTERKVSSKHLGIQRYVNKREVTKTSEKIKGRL